MRVTVKYGERWFGNSYGTPDYKLKVNSSKPRIGEPTVSLNFSFLRAIGGRGAGDNQGFVSGAAMELSSEHARQLAVNILWALEQKEHASLELVFGKAASA
jgi:hypothetical protein